MSNYDLTKHELLAQPRRWLITGVAGFIGSHLLEQLLLLNQAVVGLDNFSTGSSQNLEEVSNSLAPEQFARFALIEGDITRLADCRQACQNVDVVLHQAGLGSVPRSIKNPLASHAVNVSGFLNVVEASRENGVRRIVYASSSSVYGDSIELPKQEERIGNALSPYAATKQIDEIYAQVFARTYRMEFMGLRYFNVFGPRQNPHGPYAAVIPLWVSALIENRPVVIHGDGTTSRDFCYVHNVVQANILAATCPSPSAVNQVYNVALNARTSLNELFAIIRSGLAEKRAHAASARPQHQAPRPGDIPHSQADIAKASRFLGYEPTHTLQSGIAETLAWYLRADRQPAADPVP
jgi:UDP-N-acetylglucosamine 4-epimerase